MRSLYRSEITQTDHWMGRLLEFLRGRKLLDDTAVIFCSDHGFYLGEHDLLGKLRLERPTTIYEELGHAPLLVRHPAGLAAGKTLSGLCQPPDLFTTILELAGIPAVEWAQGYSLVPRLRGQPGAQRFAVGGCHPRKGHVGCLTVCTDEWGLIYSPLEGLNGSELYHRPSDPTQTRNVIADHRPVAEQHHEMLLSWLDELQVPPGKRRQLLHATGFGWMEPLRQRLRRWRNRRTYLKKYRGYSRRTA
jgi:arylsulfatase A-like enzyme